MNSPTSQRSEHSGSDDLLEMNGLSDVSVYGIGFVDQHEELSRSELDANNLIISLSPMPMSDDKRMNHQSEEELPKVLLFADNRGSYEEEEYSPVETPNDSRIKCSRKRSEQISGEEEADSSFGGYADNLGPKRRNQRRLQIEWSIDEDIALQKHVKDYNKQNWPTIARLVHKSVPGSPVRTPSECNQRWSRVVDPTIRKGKWSPKEDELLIEAIRCSPPRKWRVIADKIRGRTDIQVRYRLKAIGDELVARGIIGPQYLPE